MTVGKNWVVYDCKIVDIDDGDAGPTNLPKAICFDGGKQLKKAVALPRGFTTKVLLDYDFSDDGQVLSFVKEYGPVMCPYAGAIDRTFAAIEEPTAYRRLLYSVVCERVKEDGRDEGTFSRLFSLLEDFRNPCDLCDPSERFEGCDYMWDAKRLFYSGVTASAESDYLRTENRGFMRYLESDDKLVGTERLRAFAWNAAAEKRRDSGIWEAPQCLVSLEETRAVLYLLQMAAVVLQGFSYIDVTLDERRNAGIRRRGYVNALEPVSYGEASEDEIKRTKWAANYVGGMQQDIRRIERLFDLFIMGRPNLIKAFCSAGSSCITKFVFGPGATPALPDGILNAEEKQRVDRIVNKTRKRYEDDPETLALLDKRPLWQKWDGLQGDLAIFLEACLTNCWSPDGHHLVEEDSLRVGGFEDGGVVFGGKGDRMTLQKAIAGQIVENLELASKRLHESTQDGGEDEPTWRVCSECGNLYMTRNRSRGLVLLGEKEPKRVRLPTTPTCSEACRMAAKRATER